MADPKASRADCMRIETDADLSSCKRGAALEQSVRHALVHRLRAQESNKRAPDKQRVSVRRELRNDLSEESSP